MASNASTSLTARPWFWGGLIVGLLAVAAIVITVLNARVYNAQAAVEEYVAALLSGDGSTATALAQAHLASDAPEKISTVLLDGEPLAAAASVLSDAEIVAVETDIPQSFRNDSVAQQVVEIRYTDPSAQQQVTSVVVDRVGSSWLFFAQWRLHPMPLQQIELTPTQMPDNAKADEPVAHIHGQPTPLLGTNGAPATLASFAPAIISLDYSGTYLEVPETEHFVVHDVLPSGATVDFAFDVQLTQQVDDAITQEVQEELQRCTQQQVLQPTGCPFGYQTTNRVLPDSVAWSINVPEVRYSWDDSEPSIDRIMATAVLSAQEIDIGSGQQTEVRHEAPFEMTAQLELTPEYIRVRPDWQ